MERQKAFKEGKTDAQLREQVKATWPTVSGQGGGQTSRGNDRKDEMLMGGIVKATWPTPRERDTKSEEWKSQEEMAENMKHHGPPLPRLMKATWPTPRATEAGPDYAKAERSSTGMALPAVVGPPTSGPLALTGSFVERLLVLSAWLMAIPIPYLLNWDKRTDRHCRR